METLPPKNRYYHSAGEGFKSKLESCFRKVRAGKEAARLLETGDYGKGAVYVPAYCLAVSPHIKTITRRNRIEPLYYQYVFTKSPGSVFYKPGITRLDWQVLKVHKTNLSGHYSVVVGDVKRKPTQAEFGLLVTGTEGEGWAATAELQLAAHRNTPDFEKIPGNVKLNVRTKQEVKRLLQALVKEGEYVRNLTFPELTEPWCLKTSRKLPVSDGLREIMDIKDILQELRIILLEGMDQFSSDDRPGTTWTKWVELYGPRGVQRKCDRMTPEPHDVMRVRRFMAHHPNVKDAKHLRYLWIMKNEMRTLKHTYPTLSEAEIVGMIDTGKASCSISLENFDRAIKATGRTISTETPISSQSETLTLGERLTSNLTPEDEAFTEEAIDFFVNNLIEGSGLASSQIRAGIQKTTAGFKMDAKTKETLFSPWLQDDEIWKNKEHRQRSTSRAYLALTAAGNLNQGDLISKVWESKRNSITKQETTLDIMRKGLSDSTVTAIKNSRFGFIQGVYILSATGILSSKNPIQPDLIPCAKEICKWFINNGVATNQIVSKAKTEDYQAKLFDIIGAHKLTRQGYETIMNSPYELKVTLKTLKNTGVIGNEHFDEIRPAQKAKIQKIAASHIDSEQTQTPESFTMAKRKLRKIMVTA